MEEAGISTVYLGSCRDMMAQVKAPRSAFIDFPLGHQCGRPNDPDLQTRILKDALQVLATATTPGEVVELPYQWHEPFDWSCYLRGTEEMIREEDLGRQEWTPRKID